MPQHAGSSVPPHAAILDIEASFSMFDTWSLRAALEGEGINRRHDCCEAVSLVGDRARRLDIVWMQDIYLTSADVGREEIQSV